MARIRSVHPSLFTDDDFMELSSEAALLLIGLWTEAHDDGVFAWKPNGIKARVRPAANIDVPELLSELEQHGFITRFECHGKDYGAIRNFRKFQRPKKPNSSEVLPDRLRTYVGLEPVSSEPVPNHSPNASEIPPQMEDGGDKMEEKGEEEKKPRGERALIIETLSKVVTEDRAKALIAHRRNKKSPITPHIADLIVQTLSKAQDPNAAADEWMERGWQAWRPDWSDLPKVGASDPPPSESDADRMLRQLEEEAANGHPN
ncbi:hypothetical protein ABWH92_12245 [Ahrensia marina]|uniref:hypothetical protein n=1 Tax=Ahrensia marina TaxID=1514904 RepID=UPI0035D0EDA8